MRKSLISFLSFVSVLCVQASWYWPFGSDDDSDEPRLSELMEPASLLIDEASDLAADAKTSEAVDKYRAALRELDRIEMENPERSKLPEFASLRNKRAYVNAAIDSMLLSQVRKNARPVAVSDTTELERKLAEERHPELKEKRLAEEKKVAEAKKPVERDEQVEQKKPVEKKPVEQKRQVEQKKPVGQKKEAAPKPAKPLTRRAQAMGDIARGDYEAAKLVINEMLVEKPNDPVALNIRAAMETAQGRFKDAERSLDQAIMSHPRNPHAYFNMARLILQINPANKAGAKRYYETGRAVGGAKADDLEDLLK